MRELTGHKVNGCNDSLQVLVRDEPGVGGASHAYEIVCDGTKCHGKTPDKPFTYALNFQNGPIPEVGTNGVTHEVLLAVLIDRLEGFQSGKFACEANAEALVCLRVAQNTLKGRTHERVNRGVEGTHQL